MDRMDRRSDKMIREALRSVKEGTLEWDFDLQRETTKADRHIGGRLIGGSVSEAVDDMDLADAILSRFHYTVDPRHENQQEGDRWYIHENGHQVFLAPDPTTGLRWHHYEAHQKGSFKEDGYDHSFRKGGGAATLEDMLSTLHTRSL